MYARQGVKPGQKRIPYFMIKSLKLGLSRKGRLGRFLLHCVLYYTWNEVLDKYYALYTVPYLHRVNIISLLKLPNLEVTAFGQY
jgi:hypothetical protein